MGLKHFLTVGSAAALMVPMLWASPRNDKQVFRETIKNVDMGGSFLGYKNHREINKFLDQAPELIATILQSEIPRQECHEVCRIILKSLNFQAIQGSALSIAHPQNDQTVIKASLYLGNNINANGIHRIYNRGNNIPCDFARLPNDTRFYIHADIRLGDFIGQVEKEMLNSSNPKISVLPELFKQNNGITLTQLAGSLNGRIAALVRGSSMNDLAAIVYVPDANGALTQLLKRNLPAPDARGIVRLPDMDVKEYPNIKPFIMYRPGGFIFATGDAPVKEKGAFGKYAKYVPAKANGYVLIDLDAATINEIRRAVANDPRVAAFFSLLKPFTCAAADFDTGNSLNGMIFFNCNLGKILLDLPEKVLDIVLQLENSKKQVK